MQIGEGDENKVRAREFCRKREIVIGEVARKSKTSIKRLIMKEKRTASVKSAGVAVRREEVEVFEVNELSDAAQETVVRGTPLRVRKELLLPILPWLAQHNAHRDLLCDLLCDND